LIYIFLILIITDSVATIDDFAKLELRVGRVINVEDVEGARKPVYKLTIDFGAELGTRTIVAGIKMSYTKEQLLNKKIVCIVNLDPKKIANVESQGMILASGDSFDSISLLIPDRDPAEGSMIK